MKEFSLNGRLGNVLFQLAHYYSQEDRFACLVSDRQLGFIKDLKKAFNLNFGIKYGRKKVEQYFQSESCFDVEKIRNLFRFDDKCKEWLENLPENMDWDNAVSMTIRRGDYVTLNGIWTVQPAEYYLGAYEKFFNRCRCIISSDDIPWCKKHLKIPGCIYLNEITQDVMKLLFILSRCHHHIGSASSFSWWCAWLNEQEDSMNVFPDVWYNQEKLVEFRKQNSFYIQDIDEIVPTRWKMF